jgi:hypothetical protein
MTSHYPNSSSLQNPYWRAAFNKNDGERPKPGARRLEEQRMKKLCTALALCAIVIVSAVAIHAAPPRNPNFWVLNNTGHTLRSFYVSPHSSSRWGGDTLGLSQLPHGMGTFISFGNTWYCVMDFKLVFEDGTVKTDEEGMNVCPLAAVVFTEDNALGLPLPQAN